MDNDILANIKSLGIDMISKASSGHSGIVLSAAPIIYTVYARHMHLNPKDANWINRDRFVMSAGHGSALLYSTLYMAGYLSIGDLKSFREINSRTPGHPEYKITPGVEVSTGPLGQGIATAVGLAIAEKKLKAKYKELIDYHVYVLCGDGDLMEGISYEAASLAGTLNLNNLIVLYDSNNISLDGSIDYTFTENVRERFEALGWFTALVKKDDTESIDKAIKRAKKSNLPSFIEIKTTLGKGSLLQNNKKIHGTPLEKEDIKQLKETLKIKNEDFFVNKQALEHFRKQISDRSEIKYNAWMKLYNKNKEIKIHDSLDNFINKKYEFKTNYKEGLYEKNDLRKVNEKIMNMINNETELLFGGSADLFSSTRVYLEKQGDFSKLNYSGQNIWFGVREHSMGAILNGLALSGFMAYGSTYLAFADYLKPAIRMSALMNLPVTYIFTHDSIKNGKDGPTHEPIEQLSSLRNIPNFTVYRPADKKELIGCWKCIFDMKKPSALIIFKEEVYTLMGTDIDKVSLGAYIVLKERENLDAVILATGNEVETAIKIAEKLETEGKYIRVVSMPSVELFKKKPAHYRNELLPAGKKVIVIEAGNSPCLREFVSHNKYLITLQGFGFSGAKEDVLEKMNFSPEQIMERIRKLI